MQMEEPIEDGIEWSVPVLARRDENGKLAAERLDLDEGDVVCYTAFANGGIEFWSVKKSPYTSLEDDETAARLTTEKQTP
jgi:hypothetical protein